MFREAFELHPTPLRDELPVWAHSMWLYALAYAGVADMSTAHRIVEEALAAVRGQSNCDAVAGRLEGLRERLGEPAYAALASGAVCAWLMNVIAQRGPDSQVLGVSRQAHCGADPY